MLVRAAFGRLFAFQETRALANSQRPSAAAASAPRICATMKPGTSAGAMPAKVSLSDRADGHGGIGEGRRRREPIGRGDVEADGERDRVGLEAHAAENGEQQPEGGDELGEPLRQAAARRGG